jgi:hypothetical protein
MATPAVDQLLVIVNLEEGVILQTERADILFDAFHFLYLASSTKDLRSGFRSWH